MRAYVLFGFVRESIESVSVEHCVFIRHFYCAAAAFSDEESDGGSYDDDDERSSLGFSPSGDGDAIPGDEETEEDTELQQQQDPLRGTEYEGSNIRPEQAYIGITRALVMRREAAAAAPRDLGAETLPRVAGLELPRIESSSPLVPSHRAAAAARLRGFRSSPYMTRADEQRAAAAAEARARLQAGQLSSADLYSEEEWDRDTPRANQHPAAATSHHLALGPEEEQFRPRHPRRLRAISRWRELAAPPGPHESSSLESGAPLTRVATAPGPGPLDPATLSEYEAAVFGAPVPRSHPPGEEFRRLKFLRVAVVDTPADVLDEHGVASRGALPMASLEERSLWLERPVIPVTIRVRQLASMAAWPEPLRNRDYVPEESTGAEFARIRAMIAHYLEVEYPEVLLKRAAPPTIYRGCVRARACRHGCAQKGAGARTQKHATHVLSHTHTHTHTNTNTHTHSHTSA
jgi:hypothetical protein